MKRAFILLLFLSKISIGQVNLNQGLRAYYPFSGNANDVSGNNNNPVFNNAALIADRFGNANSAYHFNGTNTYMKVLNNPTINMANQMSIALWVKPTGYYTGQCYNNMMVMEADVDYVPGLYSLRFSDVYTGCTAPTTTQERFYDGIAAVATNPIVQLNQWYSVVVTYDGTTARLYVNCVLQASVPYTGSFTNLYDLYIGHTNNVQFPYWLNGDLDEVRIYDRALTVDEVNVLGGCNTGLTCTNWLRTQAIGQSVTVGDLDISGNQVTVEANFNCSSFPISRPDKQEDIVSKHANTTDINYVLRMDLAGITTTNGQFLTPFPCDNLVLNKTYHVALVYNGSTLKLYRNGFLMSQIAATGNLITNNWQTTIGDYAVNNPVGTNFLGYINEVRIWNVARTQAQLQTYMNASLPNPTTQPGLQGYYTFDNLLNKQGNATYNGTLNGGATINNTNPNCSFSADSCTVTTSCTNWLYTPSTLSSVKVGNINITGNQVTIEAKYNRIHYTTQYQIAAIDLVGKGSLGVGGSNGDQSYYLGSELAIVTTTDGYFGLLAPCASRLNKTYHAAMVYDGATLKYYRDGILINQRNATGNLTLNNNVTSIGLNEFSTILSDLSNFVGYINEVRIWNVARTQTQLQTYMNSPLPNPTIQPGLLAYYSFDNLLNKQGNVAFNGSLYGSALITQTNPSCTFTPEPGTYAFAGPDTAYCSTNPISHQLQGNGNGNFSWTPTIYLNNPSIPNPIATINTTTTFYLTVTGPTFCAVTDSVTIFVTPPPTILALADTSICKLSPLVLSTNSNATAFQWSPAGYVSNPTIQNPTFIGPNSQRLYVTGSNGQNCSAIDSVDVTVKPLPAVKTIEDAILCNTNSVTLTTTGAQTYSWNPATFLSNPNIASPVYTGNQSQTYIVTGTGVNGCNASDTVQVLVGIKPILNAGKSNDIDCANRSAVLYASGGDTYLWTPSTGLSDPNIPNPVATPTITQKYIVLVTTVSGCSNTDSVTVFSNLTASLARYMPNAFTPNGDGLNDCYGLKNWMLIKKLEFRIFNRYGEQVFATSGPYKCWDGNYKGKPALAGSYVFYIKAETSCGTEEQKGNFILIR